MADHGKIINNRTYWTWTDAKGKTVSGATPPAVSSGILGTGVGAGTNTATQYHEATYEDGTKVLSHFDPDAAEWRQDDVSVEPGIAAQYNRDNPKPAAGTSRTADQQRKDKADADKAEIEARNAGAAKPEKPATVSTNTTEPYIVTRQPDGSLKQEPNPNYVKPTTKGTIPDAAVPARRPGQKTDLTVVHQGYLNYRAQLAADAEKSGDWSGAAKKAQDYYDANVKPQIEQANREAVDYENETRARQKRSEDLSNRREDRLVGSEEERNAQARLKLYQGAEDDAVTQAYKNASNTVDPGFGERAAAQLNSYAGPGFNARPEDFVYRMPDEEAVRAKARERVSALMAYASAIPPVGGAPPAQPVQAAPPVQPPPIPPYTPQMPGPFGR